MPDLSADDTIRQTYDPIHDIGSAIYLSPDTFSRAAEWGYTNGFAFYFAGRGGVLGDVDSHVVAATFGWFNPATACPMYEEGAAVHGARHAAERMLEATALWGRDHLKDVDLDRFVEVAEKLIDGAEGAGLPLFVGWRRMPRADDTPARAAQLFQILREWRGANHVVATTAAGLSPRDAILTNEGEGQAKFFGWAEPFPDVSADKALHDEAEELTNKLCAAQVDALLSPAERADFAAGVAAAKGAIA
jgi:helix-turn-helix protein